MGLDHCAEKVGVTQTYISRTVLSIQADLSNAVISTISILPLWFQILPVPSPGSYEWF